MSGVQPTRGDLVEVADSVAQPTRQVDRSLALVLRGVLLGVAVQNGALGFAGSGERHLICPLWSAEQPGDHTVLAFPDRRRRPFAAHRPVYRLDRDLAGEGGSERLPTGNQAFAG